MAILSFVVEHWSDILLVVAALIAVGFLLKNGQTKVLRQILFSLVTEAEAKYGSGTGELKFSAVADLIYSYIPNALKPLFTAKNIEELIEEALTKAKEIWAQSAGIEDYTKQQTISKADLKLLLKAVDTPKPVKKTTTKKTPSSSPKE